jgi:acyl-coenzyme A synthetase/AMP-(fatty) acid ligase
MAAEPVNVYAPIAGYAASDPQRLAVLTPRARVSFAQLDRAVAKAAGILLSRGLGQGARAGIVATGDLPHLVLSLACARIGTAQVALPAADAPELRAATARGLGLDAVVGEDIKGAALFNQQRPPDIAMAQSKDLGWLILKSSGTTGKAKYALLSHGAALERSRRYGPLFDCRAGDVFWPLSPQEFVVAKQRSLFCLQRGATLCLPVGLGFNAGMRFAAQAGVTLACATPYHLDYLVAKLRPGFTWPALRAFEVRSATVSEPLRRRFRGALGDKLHVVYASNEAETITHATPGLQAGAPGTVGVPVDGMTVEVVDEADRPLPRGEVGRVRVKGPGVIDSYLNDAEATARSFRNGWFYPGDLAAMGAAGQLHLHGRADDLMAYDGIKIYPAEIEAVLASHAAVADAAAFPIHSRRHQHVPSAAVVLKAPASEAELMDHCRTWLGAKCPVYVAILESLPRNAMGKVLKSQLSAEAARRYYGLDAKSPGA